MQLKQGKPLASPEGKKDNDTCPDILGEVSSWEGTQVVFIRQPKEKVRAKIFIVFIYYILPMPKKDLRWFTMKSIDTIRPHN